MSRIRLAIFATHPIQYYVPIYRVLARETDLELHVFFASDFSVRGYRDIEFGRDVKWDVPLTEGYPHTFLSTEPRSVDTHRFFGLRAPGLRGAIEAYGPDCALLTAYMPFFWWKVAATLRVRRVPLLLRAEATDVALPRGGPRRAARDAFLRLFYGQVSRFLAIGRNARDHYLAHGVPGDRLGWSPYCVDTELLEKQVIAFAPRRDTIRQELGFSGRDRVFIFSGKLIPKKDPLLLVRALHGLPDAVRGRVGLIVLGDGELRAEVEAESRRALGDRCVFPGFVNQSEIGRYYAAADCLVLPSAWGETWGLVVNEAMQFGLPAIVSSRVGCHPDLVVEGETGYVFAAGAVEELRERLLQVAGGPSLRKERCRQQVAGYSVAAAAAGILEGVRTLMAGKGEG
jgi:glycosyltransferase involved in cell wall biosynthesis